MVNSGPCNFIVSVIMSTIHTGYNYILPMQTFPLQNLHEILLPSWFITISNSCIMLVNVL